MACFSYPDESNKDNHHTIILEWQLVEIEHMRNLRKQQNGHEQYKLRPI